MRNKFSERRFLIIGGAFAALYVLLEVLFRFDTFEKVLALLRRVEYLEVDELVFPIGLLSLGWMVDLVRDRRAKARQVVMREQRLRVLKATMRTVHDIVNNFLNNLRLFQFEAEEKNALSPESLQALEDLIDNTAKKLKALGDMEDTPEREVGGGAVFIDYETRDDGEKIGEK